MNFIDIRSVSAQEINQSYCGILRISPNEVDEIVIDDPSPFLLAHEREIPLSDSSGNNLNIIFIPKIFETEVEGENGKENKNLITITQKIKNNKKLFCHESLHIKSLLRINIDEDNKNKAPIQIFNKNGVLLFPIESPEDPSYLNYNRKLENTLGTGDVFSGNPDRESLFKSFSKTHSIYTDEKYKNYRVNINGEELKDKDGKPILYYHDYVLGQSAGHSYNVSKPAEEVEKYTKVSDKINDEIKYVTELSFIEIEKIVWSLLNSTLNGACRSFDGRYKELLPEGQYSTAVGTENNLWKSIFVGTNPEKNTEKLEAKVVAKSPLVGVPIQSGLILYNAIPMRRFLFHSLRRNSDLKPSESTVSDENSETLSVINNPDYIKFQKEDRDISLSDFISYAFNENSEGDDTSSEETYTMAPKFIDNLIGEYALCDGSRLKYWDNGTECSDYKSINKESFTWKNCKNLGGDEVTLYNAIYKSMNSEDGSIRTPRLFELNQYSPRFLRGLNWHRTATCKIKVADGEEIISKSTTVPYDHETMIIEPDESFNFNNSLIGEKIEIDHEAGVIYNIEPNTHTFIIPNVEETDVGNSIKDIRDVGAYYASYDYIVPSIRRHVHQLVANENLLKNNDDLWKEYTHYIGRGTGLTPKDNVDAWRKYVMLNDDNFLGAYPMRSIQGLGLDKKIHAGLIKEIQDLPISYMGGTSSAFRYAESISRNGRRRKFGGCGSFWRPWAGGAYADGGYKLAGWQPRTDGVEEGWRFLSSLPSYNKYGAWNNPYDYATASYNNKEITIDDSLPRPPSINLLPLMKI